MRLTAEQARTIRRIADEEAGAESVVCLFGSRLDTAARGGDIDLLLQMPRAIDNPALFSARIAARLMRALGGRRVDVLLSAPNLKMLPIHEIAAAEGVRL
ncbi:MAG: nucleotidyltransferase domain-containing protein [Rhodocyclaceae bacterium]|nr:nucleotidyltransferase domain-containing protein [Rhodocyclaceae bacterium]